MRAASKRVINFSCTVYFSLVFQIRNACVHVQKCGHPLESDNFQKILWQQERSHRPHTHTTMTSELDVGTFKAPPVIVIHGPRGSGLTTLLTSLLVETHEAVGLDGAVVLSTDPTSLCGVVPPNCIVDLPLDIALHALLSMQAARSKEAADEPPYRLAFVVDDTIGSSRVLKSEAIQRDIKAARQANIMVMIATSDLANVPANVTTFATHVIAAPCVVADDRKTLFKRMFRRFEDFDAFQTAMAAACGPREFLVSITRADDAPGDDHLRSYHSTVYAKDAAHARPLQKWQADGTDGVAASSRASAFTTGFISVDSSVMVLMKAHTRPKRSTS